MILGIDLGTSNSLAAAYVDGQPVIIKSRTGNKKIPSVVYIDDNDVLYTGDVAKERRYTDEKDTAAAFKRTMGHSDTYKIRDREYTSEELSALLLKNVKEDASAFLGDDITDAVISVPAFFTNIQKKSVISAGKLAGLNVKKIINEPTAAAMAYGINNQNEESKVILVLDLGGGTFDISVMEINGNVMEVVAICGDNNLGGEDFTKRIIDLFLEENGIDKKEAESYNTALYHMAERAKYEITNDKISHMKCLIKDEEYSYSLDEKTYEEKTIDLLEKIRKLTLQAIDESKYEPYEISEIIMVGGGTKLSIVKKLVEKMLGREFEYQVNPDEAVVLGTALQGALIEKDVNIKDLVMTDICPYYIGFFNIRLYPYNMTNDFQVVIPKNSTIPKKVVIEDDRNTGSRKQYLYQSEDSLGINKTLVSYIEYLIPKTKTGLSDVTMTYIYDNNGILDVEIYVHASKKTYKSLHISDDSELSQEEAQKRIEELKNILTSPYEQEENKLVLTKAERLYAELTGDARIYLSEEISQFESALKTQNTDIADEAREKLLKVINMYDTDTIFD